MITKVIEELIAKDTFIDSCEQVLESVYASDERAKMLVHRNRRDTYLVTKTDVNKVMRQLGLRYRKVNHIANTANSTTGKILRQQWARRFLDSYQEDRIYLNIDETWVSISTGRHFDIIDILL